MKTVRVMMKNNSDARKAPNDRFFAGCESTKHNGGKIVIIECDESYLETMTDKLDDSHLVASYEVLS